MIEESPLAEGGAAEDLRGRPRQSEHLECIDPIVQIVVGGQAFDAQLVDESISGVGAIIERDLYLQVDQFVQVRRNDYLRDAIVQRVRFDDQGRTCLGLKWRASHFVR